MSSFCKCKSCSHFYSAKICVYAIFNDQSFNDTFTNDIVSFEHLGPDLLDGGAIEFIEYVRATFEDTRVVTAYKALQWLQDPNSKWQSDRLWTMAVLKKQGRLGLLRLKQPIKVKLL